VVSKKHAQGAEAPDFNSGKAAVGTGPYRFVEWIKGDRVVLEANPDYWGGKATYDKVAFKPIKSSPSRVAALLAKDVDFIDYVPTIDIKKLSQTPGIHLAQAPSCRVIFLYLDQSRDETPFVVDDDGKPLFPNPLRIWQVRKAISKAIDRKGIQERVMDGYSVPAGQLIGQGMFGYNPALEAEPYDPEGAREMLVKAGYGDGFRITIHGPNDRYDNDSQILEAIAQMLTKIGLKIEVQAMPKSIYFSRMAKLEFSFGMVANCSSTGDATWPLKGYFHTRDTGLGLGLNDMSRYGNGRLDAIIVEALSTIDNTKREKLYHEAMGIAMRDVTHIPLHYQVNTWAMRDGVTYKARGDEKTMAFFLGK
jgi:peptide/nickel transport system substrate-binding protein